MFRRDTFVSPMRDVTENTTKGEEKMAFENVFLTEEEKANFKAKAIPNPGSKSSTLQPSRWTIDRDQDVFLVWGCQNRDNPKEFFFLFSWKGSHINVKLKEYWESGSPRIWELLSLGLTPNLEEHRETIISNLKDALSVWGFNGHPDNSRNRPINVQFKF